MLSICHDSPVGGAQPCYSTVLRLDLRHDPPTLSLQLDEVYTIHTVYPFKYSPVPNSLRMHNDQSLPHLPLANHCHNLTISDAVTSIMFRCRCGCTLLHISL